MQVVCGVIMKDHKFLIAKRGKGIDEGIWEFPGGKVEANETKEAAILREVKEELAVDIRILSYLTTIEDHHAKEVIYVSAFLCAIERGTVQLSVHSELEWVTAKQLFDYQFQKADTPILEMLNNKYDK